MGPHSLLSGESFPSSLATVNSRTSFILEVNSLDDRRAKESNVGDYLRHLVSQSITEESQVLDHMARDIRLRAEGGIPERASGRVIDDGNNGITKDQDDSTIDGL